MSVSPAQDLLFVACAPQYEDKMDLFWSNKGENGQWNEPTKCPVSTSEDERSVFIAADGKTVYFASDGYGGLGGLDILKTTLNPDGTFGEIINPGRPFNSEGDDYNFIINAAGDEAFFVRDGDIYRVIFKKPSPLSPEPVALIEGVITEGCDKKPLSALISFIDAATDLPIINLRSNSLTGKFSFVVNCQKEGRYRLKFMHKEREIKKSFVPETSDAFKHYEINFHLDCSDLTTEKSPQKDTLTVYFDFNSEIPQTSHHERLSFLAQNLISNRQKVSIIGHTDNKGSFAYNQALAMRRAEQIKNFLILKGVQASHIKITGKSFSEPAKTNETDEGRANNRRAILIVE
jgi:outer membrane protein OmpA-like peptidoglycan-associated protein